MNNVWVAGLIDVGYWVSSQSVEGLCVRAQNPITQHCWLQRVWSGLTHTQTQTLSFTHTYSDAQLTHSYSLTLFEPHVDEDTHLHTLFPHKNVHTQAHTHRHAGLPVLPNRNTQAAVCWMVGLGYGWRQAWLSTPVFAAVIKGACYFGGCSHTHTLKHTEGALSAWSVQYT